MPRDNSLHSVIILGAGPIIIGQACEFDYSGTQACRALKEEGYRVVLVNSNPATIMTDPQLADATYIEPVRPEIVAQIIARESPDALLPTVGGQTALNCAITLAEQGILDESLSGFWAPMWRLFDGPRTASILRKSCPQLVFPLLVVVGLPRNKPLKSWWSN